MEIPKLKKPSHKKFIIPFIILCVILSLFTAYKIFKTSKSSVWNMFNLEDKSKKFMTKDAIVKQIHEKKKLIITEVDLNETITVDNSWGNWDIFKKMQSITFSGKGIYTVDLSSLKSENLSLDPLRKMLNIEIESPKVDMITIDEQKTVYQTPQRGIFRFGDIKLTPEEHELMTKTVKEKMQSKMLEKTYMDKANYNTKKVLNDLLTSILKSDNETYKINITIK